jgi:hypothetical protein
MDAMFKKLLDPVIIKTGWHLAHGDSRDDFATDPLGYADFAFLKESRFQFIIEQIRSKRHRVARLTDIDLPKGDLSVRPGNVLPIEESTILHAAMYLIAPRIDHRLHDNVYSYRLAKDWRKRVQKAKDLFEPGDVDNVPFLKNKTIRSISIEEPWYDAWPEFDAASIKAIRSSGYTHLTKTDISAYFENIDLNLLETLMREYLPKDGEIVSLVIRMLESWTRRTVSGVPVCRGIPQGNNVSSFLGNLYLAPLDKALESFCAKSNATWFRYVDDVKVFTRSYEDARRVVFIINDALRAMHLNLQSAKTAVLYGQKLDNELYDPQLDKINTLIEVVDKMGISQTRAKVASVMKASGEIVSQFTRKLPDSIMDLSGKQNRLLRRCFTLYGMVASPRLRRVAIAAVCRVPDVRILRSGIGYLNKLPDKYHDDVATAFHKVLLDGELLFPYQAAQIIESFKYLAIGDARTTASQLRQVGWKKKVHWYVRQKTLEAIAVLPYKEKHAERLVSDGLGDAHPWVRRAAATLLPRGGVQFVRDMVKSLSYHADPEVARIALYWRRHLEDTQAAVQMLAVKPTSDGAAKSLLRQVPMLYLLRCTQNQVVAKNASWICQRALEANQAPDGKVALRTNL